MQGDLDALLHMVNTAVFVVATYFSGVLSFEPVINVTYFQVVLLLQGLALAFIIARKYAQNYSVVLTLQDRLLATNKELASHNQHLEAEVARRTQELIEVEKKNYELELDKKGRDVAMLSANNMVQSQQQQNLIEELKKIGSTEQDIKRNIKTIISRLKNQYASGEKLQVLQGDLDKINAGFYDRLKERYPQLSKSDIELCAYLKLQMSSKEIADLRRTTLNTVNVARYRLRKKLEISGQTDLVVFMQEI